MPKLINICGVGRSGTTMLDLMLGNGNNAFSCGEVYAWFRPWRSHHRTIVCSCGETPCPVWEQIKDSAENRFHSDVCRRLGVSFVIDSSKELRWLTDAQTWASESGLSVSNLLIWKPPEEMAFSHWKRNRSPLAWRKQFLQYHKAIIDLKIPFYSISFRHLSEEPATLVRAICDVIGMPYFEGKEKFWAHRSHHLFGSMGTRKQMEAGESRIRAETGFSGTFKDILPQLRLSIENDHELSKVINALRARDIRCESRIEDPPFERPTVLPSWYYSEGLKSLFKRFFPQKWHYSE